MKRIYQLSGFLNASFISLYSFNTSLTKKKLLWVISESIKVLEIKTSTKFNLVFAKNTILLCFFPFFLIIG